MSEDPKWYLAQGEDWVGPMTEAEVLERLSSGEISWAHYIWKKGQSEWKRICDTKAFKEKAPGTPPKRLIGEIKDVSETTRSLPGMKNRSDQREWFLFYNDAQFGPFSELEVDRFLQIGKIHGKVHCWKQGMEEWSRLQDMEAFNDMVKLHSGAHKKRVSMADKKPEKQDNRTAPRRPIVARIILANEDSVMTGVCRDISVGGMQVLTDRVPVGVGRMIKLNVSPSHEGKDQKEAHPIESFVAEGMVVRVLEDGRGFSFRFENLQPEAKRAIESYIANH